MLDHFQLHQYEVANFANKGCESKHNNYYWDSTQYIGVGPGAHGRFYLNTDGPREARVQTLDPQLWQSSVELNGHAPQIRQEQSHLDVLSELLATSLRSRKGAQQSRYWLIGFIFH